MKRVTFVRIIAFSLLAALSLSVVAFFALRTFNDATGFNHRQEFAISLAEQLESKTPSEAIQEYGSSHQGPRAGRNHLWIFDESGRVLAANSDEPLPAPVSALSMPTAPHEFSLYYGYFGLTPEITIVRLDSPTPTFVAIHLGARRVPRALLFLPLIFTFVMVLLAVFIALSLMFYYLQGKSKEAKVVLARLEKGDLQARFEIARFDEIGHLMLDFNRMVAEIERLVHRVQETERSRRNLLSELGHDLRTPLTGLRTSLETLSLHFEQMSAADRAEFFAMINSEFSYFIRLLEDLFFIADLDEPRYKASAERVDLAEILVSEIRSRASGVSGSARIEWKFESSLTAGEGAPILGDRQLILRLLKNGLDNAGKFAVRCVNARIKSAGLEWLIEIEDDGPGLDRERMAEFGQRRVHRSLASGAAQGFSLGLGSVIMKTIAEIHNGRVEIENISESSAGAAGARLKIFLPRSTK